MLPWTNSKERLVELEIRFSHQARMMEELNEVAHRGLVRGSTASSGTTVCCVPNSRTFPPTTFPSHPTNDGPVADSARSCADRRFSACWSGWPINHRLVFDAFAGRHGRAAAGRAVAADPSPAAGPACRGSRTCWRPAPCRSMPATSPSLPPAICRGRFPCRSERSRHLFPLFAARSSRGGPWCSTATVTAARTPSISACVWPTRGIAT